MASRARTSTQNLVWGRRPVEEFLGMSPEGAGKLWVSQELGELEQVARAHGIATERVDVRRLDEMSEGGNHQGVVLEAVAFPYVELEAVLRGLEGRSGALVLLLDQVQDVGNLGALLRSAAAFGVDAVVLPTRRAAQVTAAAIRASAGQAWRVPVVREVNLVRVIERLQREGFWVASTGAGGEGGGWDPEQLNAHDTRLGVVLGGEHEGVRRLVRERCDMEVAIPMQEGVESLNVSVSGGIVMYEATKARKKPVSE